MKLKTITIISGSVRLNRKSHSVALFLLRYLESNSISKAVMVDLNEFNFPLFSERYNYLPQPSEKETLYKNIISTADAVIIVTPEYNLSIPAAVKNAVDFLDEEWKNKPVAIATVSSGPFGGRNAWSDLAKILVHMNARVTGAGFHIPLVQSAFDDQGNPFEPEKMERRAKVFIDSLFELADH